MDCMPTTVGGHYCLAIADCSARLGRHNLGCLQPCHLVSINAHQCLSYIRLSSSLLLSILPCRGRGRSHDHANRGRNQPPTDSITNSDPPPQGLQPSESTVGGPEQSPLGRSPSNRTYSSANHLLNFQYDSYAHYGRDSRGRGGSDSRGRGGFRRPAAKPMPYNRNKFLQANFRFLVSDAGNLKKHEADADLMLDWDDVVQVGVSTHHPPALHASQ